VSAQEEVLTATGTRIGETLLALEHAALVRWCAGDPSGYLEICAADVVYFDPFLERRLDGIAALTRYYEELRGKISAERFEILNPHVQSASDMTVLTFNFVSFAQKAMTSRWNCTEVYRQDADGWRIIQSHWSITRTRPG
jgi:ketosteroid isomerase-like protein